MSKLKRNMLSVSQYCKLMNVRPIHVYYAIKIGRIVPVKDLPKKLKEGKARIYIDAAKYDKVEFTNQTYQVRSDRLKKGDKVIVKKDVTGHGVGLGEIVKIIIFRRNGMLICEYEGKKVEISKGEVDVPKNERNATSFTVCLDVTAEMVLSHGSIENVRKTALKSLQSISLTEN